MLDSRMNVVAPAAWPVRRWRAWLVSLAAVLAVTSIPIAAWAVPAAVPLPQEDEQPEPSPPGEILADGRARLPEGEIAWTLRRLDVPDGDGLAVEEFPIGFALVDTGSVTLRSEDDEADDEPTEIGAGEAELLPDRKAGSLVAGAGDAASLYEIALVPAQDATAADAPATVVGEPFPAPEGEAFQIVLTANTVTGQDGATLPASSTGAPTFYLTTEGTAQLQAGEQVVDLPEGQFALLTDEVQVRAAGDAPATYVVATIEEAEARERGERQNREERQRQPRERAASGDSGGRAGASDGASRRAARQAARAARQAQQGQGGGGGGQGQPQSPGASAPGGAGATVPAPSGTPGAEPTPEPTLPAEPAVPGDGTPPAAETPPVEETPPAEETAEPTATTPPGEAPTEEPTVEVVPTNPPVPEVPEVPGLPEVPAEETVVAETAPEAAAPVEEAPAAPVEETPPADPAAEG